VTELFTGITVFIFHSAFRGLSPLSLTAGLALSRWFATGYDIAKLTNKQLEKITQWINNYPRKLIDYYTAQGFLQTH